MLSYGHLQDRAIELRSQKRLQCTVAIAASPFHQNGVGNRDKSRSQIDRDRGRDDLLIQQNVIAIFHIIQEFGCKVQGTPSGRNRHRIIDIATGRAAGE
jgi:hypothetical protein